MAKIIKLTQDCLIEIRKDFEEALRGAKLSDGKISFSKNFGCIKRDATVYFTNEAWQKMQALIKGFDKEVAWHGTAFRGENGTDDYFITDILVYPQEVTGATVNTDQEKYQMWLMNHDDDVFNNIRMQGHSHVNMGVTPSGVDTSLYERILEQLDDDMFYIFLIYNKRGDKTFKIYDLAKNILFETSDVTVKVLDNNTDGAGIHLDSLTDEENKAVNDFLVEYRVQKRMDEFTKSAKEMVKDKVYTPTQYGSGYYGSGYGGNYGYGGYGGYNGGYNREYHAPASQTPPAKPSETKKEEVTKFPTTQKSGKRKGKRNGKKGGGNKSGCQQLSIHNACGYTGYDDEDDGWDDSPYSPFGYSDSYHTT